MWNNPSRRSTPSLQKTGDVKAPFLSSELFSHPNKVSGPITGSACADPTTIRQAKASCFCMWLISWQQALLK